MYLFIFYTFWILAILPSVHFGQKSSLVRLSLISYITFINGQMILQGRISYIYIIDVRLNTQII